MNIAQPAPEPRLERSVGRAVFGEDAAGYDSARLGYPAEIYDAVFGRLGQAPSPAILEIGAGTGLATRDLLARAPARLVAIEPDARLAAFLAASLADSTEVRIENQPFEAVELPAAGFDLVAAAASFHWLEPVSALARIRAALKPGGILALWWHVYRAAGIGDPFADAVIPMLEGFALPPSEGAQTHHSLNADWHRALLADNGFEAIEHRVLRRERSLATSEMRDLYASYSFVRQLPDAEREALLNRIAALVDDKFGGQAPNVVLTPLYTAVRSD
jgi:SAM-dependent methyltransferase